MVQPFAMVHPHLKSVSLKSYGMFSPKVLNLRRSRSTLWKYASANSSFWYLAAAGDSNGSSSATSIATGQQLGEPELRNSGEEFEAHQQGTEINKCNSYGYIPLQWWA